MHEHLAGVLEFGSIFSYVVLISIWTYNVIFIKPPKFTK